MSGVSDTDFELLNALADGELKGIEKEKLLKRIVNDDALRDVYGQINEVKNSIASIHQNEATNVKKLTKPAIKKPLRYLALAASVASIAILTSFQFYSWNPANAQPTTALAWHELFSNNQYVVSEERGPLFISINANLDVAIPDLSLSRLFLVEQQAFKDQDNSQTAALHYRGFNGCRLTVWIGAKMQNTPSLDPKYMHYNWTAGALEYRMLATGMDTNRFNSVAQFMESTSRFEQNKKDEKQLLMASAYENAVPCS